MDGYDVALGREQSVRPVKQMPDHIQKLATPQSKFANLCVIS